jgi:hypothetical protein
MASEMMTYRAAYESHHVAHVTEFDTYDRAADSLHVWKNDVHSWPVGIYEARENRLWLWCGYKTLDISRESALEDARAIFGLSGNHQFAKVEVMAENFD